MENHGRGVSDYNQNPNLSHLIEPGVRGFLHKTLNECRKFNDRHSNMVFNLYAVGVFVLIFGGFLLYMYKGKLTKEEIDARNRRTHEYVISKIHKFSHNRTGEFIA